MNQEKAKLAIFSSGNGTNAEKIFKYFRNHPSAEVVLLLTNNPNAFVIERAGNFGVPVKVFNGQQFRESDEVLKCLQEKSTTHIILAGFLWLMPQNMIREFPGRIINIHPALLPKFGGKGMYGNHVHEVVKQAGEKETGITIHLVNEKYDEGTVLFQAKCNINSTDTPEQIAAKVHQLEYEHYPSVIEQWILSASPSPEERSGI